MRDGEVLRVQGTLLWSLNQHSAVDAGEHVGMIMITKSSRPHIIAMRLQPVVKH
jgi:hypothetical protein